MWGVCLDINASKIFQIVVQYEEDEQSGKAVIFSPQNICSLDLERIKPLSAPPEFVYGARVSPLDNPNIKGNISRIFWHFDKNRYYYKIKINGKLKSRRYFAEELAAANIQGDDCMSLIGLSHVFPCGDIERTAEYYECVLGFRAVKYLDVIEPHICLYRDNIEIILTCANQSVKPNRVLYGYGYDAYFYTLEQERLFEEFAKNCAKFAKPLCTTDYQNREFVVEDIDGRWLAFGTKEKS